MGASFNSLWVAARPSFGRLSRISRSNTVNFGAGKSAGCWGAGWRWAPRKLPGGFWFFTARLAPRCQHKQHHSVIFGFRAHPCLQARCSACWGPYHVPKEPAGARAQLTAQCQAGMTLPWVPGSKVLILLVPPQNHPIATRLARRRGKEGRMSRLRNLPTGSFTRELARFNYPSLRCLGC